MEYIFVRNSDGKYLKKLGNAGINEDDELTSNVNEAEIFNPSDLGGLFTLLVPVLKEEGFSLKPLEELKPSDSCYKEFVSKIEKRLFVSIFTDTSSKDYEPGISLNFETNDSGDFTTVISKSFYGLTKKQIENTIKEFKNIPLVKYYFPEGFGTVFYNPGEVVVNGKVVGNIKNDDIKIYLGEGTFKNLKSK